MRTTTATYRGLSATDWFNLAVGGKANPEWRVTAYQALSTLGANERLKVSFNVERDVWAKFSAAIYLRRLCPNYAPVLDFLETFLKERYGSGVDLVEWEKLLSEGQTPLQLETAKRDFFHNYPFRSNATETQKDNEHAVI